ncbi:MAG TPA: Dam family site-specific DNA-(adenine-N6)-methyltransferase [Acholeplasmataceae bacterium]|nr:Dam family site-specific DNA-(adenine-N6)-methyltransferase [Acholeplasmataceae bacterium]
MKPFLKWAGGKRQILSHIKEYINNDVINEEATYFEPFIGGGSLFFDLGRNNCVINDYNEEIINVYKVIRDHPIGLIRMLKHHQKNDSDEYFYKIRDLDRDPSYKRMGNVKKAARTIYLNKTCYNGLFRVNGDGYFNTPRGKYSNPLICDAANIKEVSNFLNQNNILILNSDFENACPNAKEGDYVYFDPPYDYEDESGFVAYNPQGFTRNDLMRMKKFCDQLIEKGCVVLISNNDTTYVRDLFSGENYKIVYEINQVAANRSINSSGKKRSSKVREVLIYGTRR